MSTRKRLHALLATLPEGADPSPVTTLARFNVHFFDRRFDEAIALLEKLRG